MARNKLAAPSVSLVQRRRGAPAWCRPQFPAVPVFRADVQGGASLASRLWRPGSSVSLSPGRGSGSDGARVPAH